MSDDKSIDVLGVKPLAIAVEHVSKATVDGASNFLGRICMPAAGEFGLLLQDQVRAWRATNMARILEKAERRLAKHQPDAKVAIHPRLLAATLENGSWADNELLREMWAGLLASSCTPSGKDETNIVFTTLLARMTPVHARLITFACEQVAKELSLSHELIVPRENLVVPTAAALGAANLHDVHQLDIELDHMRVTGLILSGFQEVSLDREVDLTPTSLALNLYVRAQGFVGPAGDYFGIVRRKT